MAKTVFVFGELNVDMILSGAHIQPEPNKEKIVDDFVLTLGSSSAITACRLAQLGLEVYFVSVVGDDQFGHYCVERLKHFHVRTDWIKVDPLEKTGACVSLSTPQDRALLTYMGTIPKLSMELIPDLWKEKADHIHFGSLYLQRGMINHWLPMFTEAQELGITTSFDLGWDPAENWNRSTVDQLLAVTDLFMPSEDELLQVYHCSKVEETAGLVPASRGRIAVKRGKRGSDMLTADGRWLHADGFPVHVVDTTGAGDSFNAGLITRFLEGSSDLDMLAFGNACGALSTLAAGGTGGELTVKAAESLIRGINGLPLNGQTAPRNRP